MKEEKEAKRRTAKAINKKCEVQNSRHSLALFEKVKPPKGAGRA
jgi:hypothetical protein